MASVPLSPSGFKKLGEGECEVSCALGFMAFEATFDVGLLIPSPVRPKTGVLPTRRFAARRGT